MAEDEQRLLCQAAANGDVEKVKALIASGADVSYFNEDGFTPLMLAAKNGYADVVKILLEAGAPWNALSPSNLSAGDFAMDSGHQDAFDVLLNAGIQAELILGTIARRENKVGDLDGDYLEDRVSFSEDKLMDANSKAVMMAWEKPLMEAHAKAVCSRGGHILNIGFGMGLVDTAIQQYGPVTHTIVEAHPEVYDRMRLSGWSEKENVKIVFGRWQDVLHQLDSYDGIFFDTYGEYYEDLREFQQHLPTLLKPGGIYSFFNGLCGVSMSQGTNPSEHPSQRSPTAVREHDPSSDSDADSRQLPSRSATPARPFGPETRYGLRGRVTARKSVPLPTQWHFRLQAKYGAGPSGIRGRGGSSSSSSSSSSSLPSSRTRSPPPDARPPPAVQAPVDHMRVMTLVERQEVARIARDQHIHEAHIHYLDHMVDVLVGAAGAENQQMNRIVALLGHTLVSLRRLYTIVYILMALVVFLFGWIILRVRF